MNDQPAQVAAMAVVSTGELRVGRVLSLSLEILIRQFGKFVLIALVATLLRTLIAAFGAGPFVRFQIASPAISLFLFSYLVNLPLGTIAGAATYYGTVHDLRGEPFRLGEAFGRGFARFLPLLGVEIVSGVVYLVGFILLVAPSLMWVTRFYVSSPVCLMEGTGPLKSMGRSGFLTDGHRWKLFALYLLFSAVSYIVDRAFGVVGGVLFGEAARLYTGLFTLVWSAPFGAYKSIVDAVVYHELRVLREGPDTDRIAAVFD